MRGTLPRGSTNILDAAYESLDYEDSNSMLKRTDDLERYSRNAAYELRNDTLRWVITFAIGILTALVALFIETTIQYGAK